MIEFKSIPDFFQAHKGDIFRFWVYRRVYTPYEQQQAFMDESVFEDTHAIHGIVVECAPLGASDFLLGFLVVPDPDEERLQEYRGPIEYYKLSEIRINLYQQTTEEE